MTKIPNYQRVSTKTGLKKLLSRCSGAAALDFETTALRPEHGRVRLVSLSNDQVNAVVDFDRIRGGFKSVAKLFEIDCDWVVFNAGFELRWFYNARANPSCVDVGFLRRAILGGGGYSLAKCVQWDLGIDMSKEMQVSNWSAERLTTEQLDYAYLDAHLTWQLWRHWSEKADEGRWSATKLFNDMVPAVIEMEDTGMLLDHPYHKRLISDWTRVQEKKLRVIRKFVSEDDVANVDSNNQWSDFFARIMPDAFLRGWPRTEKTGQLQTTGEVLRNLAAHIEINNPSPDNPLGLLFDSLADYKTISKYLSSFGESLLEKSEQERDKRVRARFNIAQAKTGRFSSSGPNLQQIPRDRELLGTVTSVRRSFVAGLGRKLVSLDYSGIELRVLALLSDDKQLLKDVVEGDVHSEVAAVIAGHEIDKTTPEGKAARSKAKGVSFGIIYGSAATGLSVTMRCSVEKAQGYIDSWSDRYYNAFRYRDLMMDEAYKTRYIRCADGGTIYMGKTPEIPKAANYPVQRAALSVMAKAIARHKATLDKQRANGYQRMTRMLSTIHDALIDEASSRDAEDCLQLMELDMTAAYLDIFPDAPLAKLVEGGIGPNWGELD